MKKNLFAFASAALALALTFSCSKAEVAAPETAPAPETGQEPEIREGTGTVSFTAAFGENLDVKSYLGAGLVPTWVDDDAIGITTASDDNVECGIDDPSAGTFSGDVTGSAPFYAVFPYEAGNTFSGDVLTASVPSTQTVPSGKNVAADALVAACKSDGTTLSLKNCVSLIQITVPLSTIKKIEIQAGADEYLSGQFTMDLTENPLAPAAVAVNAVNKVTLVPSGAAFAAGTYYAAVIPGDITSITVTFTDTADETVSVAKNANASLGRSGGVNLGNFFVYEINTADDLLKWAKQSSKYTSWDVVNLNADIALTPAQAAEYVEVKNFTGTFNGNDHTISGLTVPMFGTLMGWVNHLTLNSSIVTNGVNTSKMNGSTYGTGILAHGVEPAAYTSQSISYVTTRGSLTVDGVSMAHNYFVGGVIGYSTKVPLDNCVNEAAINVNSATLSSGQVRVGGIVGCLQGAGATAGVSYSQNLGAILLEETTVASGHVSIGGIAGVATQPVTISNCINGSDSDAASGYIYSHMNCAAVGAHPIAGILGATDSAVRIESCTNYGRIHNAARAADDYYACGILSYNTKGTATTMVIDGCKNYGALDLEPGTVKGFYAGGILGRCNGATPSTDSYVFDITNCENHGAINASGTASNVRFGGIVAYSAFYSRVKGCTNDGAITNNSAASSNIYLGGIFANSDKGAYIDGCSNHGRIRNEGTASSNMMMAGIMGNFACGQPYTGATAPYGTINDCDNYGAVENESGSASNYVALGGIVAWTSSSYTYVLGCDNTGDVSNIYTGGSSLGTLRMGGIWGRLGNASSKISGGSSKAAVSYSGAVTNAYVAGIVGWMDTSVYYFQNVGLGGSVNGTSLTAGNFQDNFWGGKSGGTPDLSTCYFISD